MLPFLGRLHFVWCRFLWYVVNWTMKTDCDSLFLFQSAAQSSSQLESRMLPLVKTAQRDGRRVSHSFLGLRSETVMAQRMDVHQDPLQRKQRWARLHHVSFQPTLLFWIERWMCSAVWKHQKRDWIATISEFRTAPLELIANLLISFSFMLN